jgi:Zn-dependent peptidase ImmA (M78 family)
MRIPEIPREAWAADCAKQFIMDNAIFGIPVYPIRIAKRMGWAVYTVGYISRKCDIPRDQVLNGKDGDSYYCGGKYAIVYDENRYARKVTYTIAHEIGHIVLGHLVNFDQTSVLNGELSDHEYWVLDREAEIFAANLLMPCDAISAHFKAPVTVPGLGKLINRFVVSWQSMIIRLDELGLCNKCEIAVLLLQWEAKKNHRDTRLSIFEIGKKLAKQFRFINICTGEVPQAMVTPPKMTRPFEAPGMDANMRYLSCPFCGNDDFSAEASYCKRCGTYLFNECTNVEESFSGYCGKRNVSDALYCEYCGSTTSLYGLLRSMDILPGKPEKEIAAAVDENPPPHMNDDDDAPF